MTCQLLNIASVPLLSIFQFNNTLGIEKKKFAEATGSTTMKPVTKLNATGKYNLFDWLQTHVFALAANNNVVLIRHQLHMFSQQQ